MVIQEALQLGIRGRSGYKDELIWREIMNIIFDIKRNKTGLRVLLSLTLVVAIFAFV